MANNSIYQQRRRQLLQQLDNDSIVFIPAAPEAKRNGDTDYPYRQDSDLYYLTGFTEPEAVAVLIPNHDNGEFILFNRSHDPVKETWMGKRAGQDGAVQEYGADQAFPISEFATRLPELLQNGHKIYYPTKRYQAFDNLILDSICKVQSEIFNLNDILHRQRMIKDEHEIAMMRKAAAVSAQAHQQVIQTCKPHMYEYELEAVLLHEFCRAGCRHPAYESIVASGENACTLHYVANNARLDDGDLVLIDAGAEYQCYASDITRTMPVNGHYNPEQKAIYEIVLAAQLAGLAQLRPGVSWHKVKDAVETVIIDGLLDLGFEKGSHNRFYMHNWGHWLGLDVHDVGIYKEGDSDWITFQPGMVTTIEPGIYISSNHDDVDPKWRGIGVRIEDDVLITEQGHEVLSAAVPKTITDIEALMKS